MVLVPRTSADPDGPNHLSAPLQRYASGEDHDLPIVGGVNAKELVTRLAVRGQILSGNIEGPRGVGLLNRNIDAPDPCTVHPYVSHQIPSLVSHRYVHRLSDLGRFLLGNRNDPARIA